MLKALRSGKVIQVKSNTEFHVWATSRYSLWDLSLALRTLNVTHTVESEYSRKIKRVNMRKPQPMAVHLTYKLDGFQSDAVNFISAAVGALVDTNFKSFPSPDLESSLKQILTTSVPIVPAIIKRDAANYVENLAKPSLLNTLQTEVNRIQPYDLRKKVQAKALDFFNSRISIRDMVLFLESSMKTERLLPLFRAGVPLRKAVAMLKISTVAEVESATGFSSFELLYLTKAGKAVT